MEYEWDKMKNDIHQQKHRLSVEDAYLVFEGECVTFNEINQKKSDSFISLHNSGDRDFIFRLSSDRSTGQ